MAIHQLERDGITIRVNEHGAELISLQKNNHEYMWSADPAYWGRTAPVLFPIVGGVKDKRYTLDGKTYSMGQHGFARDNEFACVEKTENALVFSFASNEKTREVYPYDFRLEITYRIIEGSVEVIWKVYNTDSKSIYFSIGGHPAFACPYPYDATLTLSKVGNRLGAVTVNRFGTKGLVTGVAEQVATAPLTVSDEVFSQDALVIEGSQTDCVTLDYRENGQEYSVKIQADTPLMGLWTPPMKHAPFVCIEPWYGRCDAEDFDGEFTEREYTNLLPVGESFVGGFTITV